MNENQLIIVKYHEIEKPDIHKRDFLIDKCIRGCYNKHFQTFEYICVYGIKITNIGKIEKVDSASADKGRTLYELIDNIKIARQKGFFNQ